MHFWCVCKKKKKIHVTSITRQKTDEQFWKVLQSILYFSRVELRLIILMRKKNDNFVVACRKNSDRTKVYIVDI